MFLDGHNFKTTYSAQQKNYTETTYYVQQHILLFNICGLYNINVQQHIYVLEQHVHVIEFYQTYVCHVSLNNIHVMHM